MAAERLAPHDAAAPLFLMRTAGGADVHDDDIDGIPLDEAYERYCSPLLWGARLTLLEEGAMVDRAPLPHGTPGPRGWKRLQCLDRELREVEGQLVDALCDLWCAAKIEITADHPDGSGSRVYLPPGKWDLVERVRAVRVAPQRDWCPIWEALYLWGSPEVRLQMHLSLAREAPMRAYLRHLQNDVRRRLCDGSLIARAVWHGEKWLSCIDAWWWDDFELDAVDRVARNKAGLVLTSVDISHRDRAYERRGLPSPNAIPLFDWLRSVERERSVLSNEQIIIRDVEVISRPVWRLDAPAGAATLSDGLSPGPGHDPAPSKNKRRLGRPGSDLRMPVVRTLARKLLAGHRFSSRKELEGEAGKLADGLALEKTRQKRGGSGADVREWSKYAELVVELVELVETAPGAVTQVALAGEAVERWRGSPTRPLAAGTAADCAMTALELVQERAEGVSRQRLAGGR